MKDPTRWSCPLAGSIALLLCATALGDSIKSTTTDPLTAPASWTNGVVPGPTDLAIWDSTITAGNTSALGGNLSILGVRIGNVGGARNTGSNGVHIGNTAGATLTIGAGGVDMSAALQAFRILSSVTIGASQTWNIANANTAGGALGLNKNEDFALSAPGTGITFDLAGFEVTKTGAGTAAFGLGPTITSSVPGGAFNLNAGVFAVQSGSNRTTTLTSAVTLNLNTGATLQFFSESPAGGTAIQSGATINLNGGTLLTQVNQAALQNHTGNIVAAANTTWNLTGAGDSLVNVSGNLSGAGNINHVNNATTARVVMSGDNSGYTGTFTLAGTTNARALRMAHANSGSANATWVVNAGNTLEIEGVTVSLGVLNGAGTVIGNTGTAGVTVGSGTFTGLVGNGTGTLSVTKVGTGTLTLTGANTYSGPTVVTAGTLITTTAHTGAGAVTVNDGGTLALQLHAAGATFTTPSFTTGSVSGSTIRFDTKGHGNPQVAMITAGNFAPIGLTVLDVAGTALSSGIVPLIDYAGTLAGGSFDNLSVTTPFRIGGTLLNNLANTSIDVDLSVETPRWNGNAGPDWDIQTTQNWRTFTSNTPTQYFQGVNTDIALFDNNASGSTTVNLTTVLTPVPGAIVNNDAKTYTFSGTGILSGASSLEKQGPGTLILANSVAYDHTGGTLVSGGILQIGDGATPGLGSIPTAGINNQATLRLNRPDDFGGSLNGNGTFVKEQANVFTITNPFTSSGTINLLNGTLATSAGGNFSGVISGPGGFTSGGGTLQLSGTAANTHAGLTTVSAGILQLNKPAEINAVAGDVLITGSGVLSLLASQQIPDTATITFTGTSGDSLAGAAAGASEKVANVIVNPSVAGGQFIMRNNFEITGMASVQNGILGVASNHSATVRAITLTGGIVRIAASANPSTLNVGAGGITASGGQIQVKFDTQDRDATLNLAGDFTSTGNVSFNNANYTGANLNVINLIGERVFTIGEGTITTVAPDLAGDGGLIKAGNGTLLLTPASAATYPGATIVAAGTLEVNGSITGSSIIVDGGTLAGTGAITPGILGLVVDEGGKLAPGTAAAPETFSINLSGGATMSLTGAVNAVNSQALVFRLESPALSSKLVTTAGSIDIGIQVLEFDDFLFTAGAGFDAGGTYTLFDGDSDILGSLGSQVRGDIAGQMFELQFADDRNDLVLVAVPEPGSAMLLLAGLGAFASRRRRSTAA